MVGAIPGTNVTLCCEASGSPRPNVEWFQAQKASVSFPVFQEDGCLLIKMVKEDVDFICRAKNSFGMAETTTTVIAEIFGGIIYYFCCKALKICWNWNNWKVLSLVTIITWKVLSLVLIAQYVF